MYNNVPDIIITEEMIERFILAKIEYQMAEVEKVLEKELKAYLNKMMETDL